LTDENLQEFETLYVDYISQKNNAQVHNIRHKLAPKLNKKK